MKSTRTFSKMIFLSLLGITFLVSSCKKDEETVTKTSLLTKSGWKMTGYSVDPAFPVYDDNGNITGTTSDMLSMMETCDRDDVYYFKTDKTAVVDEGLTKCDPTDPQSSPGSWEFKSGETVLSVTSDGYTEDYTIVELTASALRFKFTDTSGLSSYTYTLAFSH